LGDTNINKSDQNDATQYKEAEQSTTIIFPKDIKRHVKSFIDSIEIYSFLIDIDQLDYIIYS